MNNSKNCLRNRRRDSSSGASNDDETRLEDDEETRIESINFDSDEEADEKCSLTTGQSAMNEASTLDEVIELHNKQLACFIRKYRVNSWHENVFVIFGSLNLSYALLFPQNKLLPLRGLEWSFMTLGSENSQASKDDGDQV